MSAKSAYLRSALIQHALGESSFTMPSGAYLALYTSDPTIDNTGTEVSGGSYARQQISWSAEADGILENDTALSFSALPNIVTGTVTHWGILDASSGGNLLYFGQFDTPIVVVSGDSLTVAVGNVSIREE